MEVRLNWGEKSISSLTGLLMNKQPGFKQIKKIIGRLDIRGKLQDKHSDSEMQWEPVNASCDHRCPVTSVLILWELLQPV